MKATRLSYEELASSSKREIEQLSSSLSNLEARCESLKTDIRGYLRQEQEYEDQLEFLIKENKKLTDELQDVNKTDMRSLLKSKEIEIESLNIQLATYKTENDSLLIEKHQFKNDIDQLDFLKSENQRKDIEIQSYQST